MKQHAALGKFITLRGIVERNVPCCVFGAGIDDPALGIKANNIAREFLSKVEVYELTNV